MRTRTLGCTGLGVSEIGFDAAPSAGRRRAPDEADSVALRAAVDAGINLIDAGPGSGAADGTEGDGRSDRAIAAVLTQLDVPQRESLCLAVRIPPAPGPCPPSPYCRWQDRYGAAYLRESVHQRLRHLGITRIGLLQLQTWTRAWNDDPQPLLVLRRLREEGKVGLVGVCPAEHDQDSVIQLMRDGLVDVVQIVFNLFHQEPAAQLLAVADETGTGVIVRGVLDNGVLTGRYAAEHAFAEDDARRDYFAGDRLQRCAQRVEQIADDLQRLGLSDRYTLADAALKFALQQQAVSSVIVGMRNAQQVHQITAAAELPDLAEQAIVALRRHNWRRGIWSAGK